MRMITVAEAAELTGFTRSYIHLLIDLGMFPGARKATSVKNSPYLIPLKEVQDWMKKRGQPPTRSGG